MKYLLVIACVIALTFAQDDESLEQTKVEEAQNMMMMNPMMMGGMNGMNGMNGMSGMGRPMMSRNQFPVDYSQGCSSSCGCVQRCQIVWWVPCNCWCPPPCETTSTTPDFVDPPTTTTTTTKPTTTTTTTMTTTTTTSGCSCCTGCSCRPCTIWWMCPRPCAPSCCSGSCNCQPTPPPKPCCSCPVCMPWMPCQPCNCQNPCNNNPPAPEKEIKKPEPEFEDDYPRFPRLDDLRDRLRNGLDNIYPQDIRVDDIKQWNDNRQWRRDNNNGW